MAKKWKIDLFFEKYLARYYKNAKNGKKELLGVDGANHGLYASLIAIGVGFGCWFLGLNKLTTGLTIGMLLVCLFFFIMEVYQEKARLKRMNYNNNPFLWFTTKNAQINDFIIPVIAYAITAIMIISIKVLTGL